MFYHGVSVGPHDGHLEEKALFDPNGRGSGRYKIM